MLTTRASDMSQGIKAPKLEDLSSIPQIHTLAKRTDSRECVLACSHPHSELVCGKYTVDLNQH